MSTFGFEDVNAFEVEPVGCFGTLPKLFEGCWERAEEGGVSSNENRSVAGSGSWWLWGFAGEKGDVPTVRTRAEGGIKDGGNLDGTSCPANFFWMRYIAIANPSLVKRPSLLMSARSLKCFPVRLTQRQDTSSPTRFEPIPLLVT